MSSTIYVLIRKQKVGMKIIHRWREYEYSFFPHRFASLVINFSAKLTLFTLNKNCFVMSSCACMRRKSCILTNIQLLYFIEWRADTHQQYTQQLHQLKSDNSSISKNVFISHSNTSNMPPIQLSLISPTPSPMTPPSPSTSTSLKLHPKYFTNSHSSFPNTLSPQLNYIT